MPVAITARDHLGSAHRPLQDHAMLGLGPRLGDRGIEQRLVGHDPIGLDPARSRQDYPRLGVVDTGGELVRAKAAKDDRVNRADAGAGQHRHRRLGDHRHIDQDAIALGHPEPGEDPRETRDVVAQLAVGELLNLVRYRAVPDQRRAVAAPSRDMAVERVPAGVEPGAREPAIEWRHPVPAALPIDRRGRLRPEFLRPLKRPAMGLDIAGRHCVSPHGRLTILRQSRVLEDPHRKSSSHTGTYWMGRRRDPNAVCDLRDQHQNAIACVEPSLNGTELLLSVFILVLLIPQRVVEIEDTLTESGAARVDTDVGASQARLRPIGLVGVLDRIGAATAHQQCCKRASQDDARHCNLQSELYRVELGLLQRAAAIAALRPASTGDRSASTTQTAKAGVPGLSPFRAHVVRFAKTSPARSNSDKVLSRLLMHVS
jgi:hypothetical protein